MKITDTHKQLLKEIRKDPNITLKELMELVEVNAISTVDYYLKQLMAEGLLRRGNKWEVINQDVTSRT